jgi:transcriptional regulator with XRE-family HTH domain
MHSGQDGLFPVLSGSIHSPHKKIIFILILTGECCILEMHQANTLWCKIKIKIMVIIASDLWQSRGQIPKNPSLDKSGAKQKNKGCTSMSGCNIGLRIAKIRCECGYESQQEFADALSARLKKEGSERTISREKIKNWENSERAIKADDLILISKCLGVSIDYLLELSQYPSIEGKQREAAEYTGLSEKAVAVLHNLKERQKYKMIPLLDYASALITSNSFSAFLGSLVAVNAAVDHLNELKKVGGHLMEVSDILRDIRIAVFEGTEVYKGVIDELYHTDEYFRKTAESIVYGEEGAQLLLKMKGAHER